MEPDFAQREALLEQVIAYSQDYLEGTSSSPANYPFADGRGLYDSPIAEEGIGISEALGLLKENVDRSGITTTSGRFMGYIPGGALFHEKIQLIDGFEVGPYPDLSAVTYRFLPERGNADAFNERLAKKIQEDGRVFISSTRIDGKFILRLAISSFRTHLIDIDEALDVLEWSVSPRLRGDEGN